MKILLQIAVIFLLCMIGDALSALLPFTLPGSIISMVLLFLLLLTGLIKVHHIETKAAFLQQNMAFFFIPASVAIMDNLPLLKSILLPFLVICTVSTLLTFAATAVVTALTIRLMHFFSKSPELQHE